MSYLKEKEIEAEIDEIFEGYNTKKSQNQNRQSTSKRRYRSPKIFGVDLERIKELTSKELCHSAEADEMRQTIRKHLNIHPKNPLPLITMSDKTLGQRLAYAIEHFDIPQQALALLAKVSAGTISSTRKDSIHYTDIRSLRNLYRIAEALHIDWTWMVTGILPQDQDTQYDLEQDQDELLHLICVQEPYCYEEWAQPLLERNRANPSKVISKTRKSNSINQVMELSDHSRQRTQNNSNSTVNNYYQNSRYEDSDDVAEPHVTPSQPQTTVTATHTFSTASESDTVPMYDFNSIGYPMLNELVPNVFKKVELSDYGMIYQLQRRKTDGLCLITVNNNDSAPDININDIAIVDTKQNMFMVNGFYAFIQNNQFTLATIIIEDDGSISVLKNRRKFTFTQQEISEQFKIIGRAIKLIKMDIKSL